MPDRSRRSVGLAVLILGWSIVAVGVGLLVVGLTSSGPGRDERAGGGLALVMTGMLVVLAGNYGHHGGGVSGPDRPGPP